MRDTWEKFFYGVAEKISERSTCLRRQYGCVLVRDKTIISTGFNGAPRGCEHCTDIGACARVGLASGVKPEICRAAHAEQNVIANAARMGMCTMGSELYIYPPDLPCPLCAKILINAGVSVIHYRDLPMYSTTLSLTLFEEAGVSLVVDI